MASSPAMPLVAALEVLRDVRTDQIVISSMGTAREWPKLSRHPLDFHYVPSTMGGAVPLGLGLAMANPRREVIALTGDGSLLMNLGCLATVAASGVENLSIVVFDNRVYEVTGVQHTVAGLTAVDFAGVGRDCGLRSVRSFASLDAWRSGVRNALAMPGPRVVVLHVEPVRVGYQLTAPQPIREQVERFRVALLKS